MADLSMTPDAIPGAGRCPKCGSRAVTRRQVTNPAFTKFYGDSIELCDNPACHAAWEPFDPAQLLDPEEPRTSSFKEPCDNCAFRPGSLEQRKPEGWRDLMAQLKGTGDPYGMLTGSGFYCHKGVPLDPGGPQGFAYPTQTVEFEGHRAEVIDRRRLRPCRGWLRMVRTALDRLPVEEDETADLAACPRCGGPLWATDNGPRCLRCDKAADG